MAGLTVRCCPRMLLSFHDAASSFQMNGGLALKAARLAARFDSYHLELVLDGQSRSLGLRPPFEEEMINV